MPDGEFLVESLARMKINMDKHKTSNMGRSLKKVYRGEMSVEEVVNIAKSDIGSYFTHESLPPEEDTDTGFFGDEIGKCPLCGGLVKRFRYNYGCSEYKNGCKFSIPSYLCKRDISVSNAKLLLDTGRSSKIKGFVSKKGTPFDSYLVIENGKCIFSFDT